ncbi:MAG: M1 family aminopeptidase [Bacteroidota bacterium]
MITMIIKTFITLMFTISLIYCQEMKFLPNLKYIQPWMAHEGLTGIDTGIVHQELNINLADGLNSDTALYSVYQRITCRYDSPTPRPVTFDAESTLVIDSVSIKGSQISVARDTHQLTVQLSTQDFISDSCIIDLWYRYVGSGLKGFFYYKKNPQQTLEPLAYTFTEPYDSPYWFVTKNDNRVKPTLAMNITVPDGYEAGSNGILTGKTSNPNGSVTFQWRENHPIAMYLTAFAASKYKTFSDYYHRVGNPHDSVEIKYYVWNDDYDMPVTSTITYSAKRCFVNVVDMMEYYSRIFGEYPFDKYGMVAVYPFKAGGMEHQTLTTIHRNWIRVQQGHEHGFTEGGIAHEMVHQWFGDLITCGTWSDIWLNESFATYGEKLWQEHFYGKPTFDSLMRRTMFFSNPTWAYPIYNPPSQDLFGDLVYDKGSWVLHMLRYVMGDSSFFTLLKTYATDQSFYFKTALTSQFADLASQITGQDLSQFFDQWIYHTGWPVYEYSSLQSPSSDGYTIWLLLSQVQNDPIKSGNIPHDGTIFVMPVQLRCYMNGKDTLITVMNTQSQEAFSFTLPQHVDSIVVDPDNRILKQFYNPQTITNFGLDISILPTEFRLYQNYPNPFNPYTVIRYDIPRSTHVVLSVTNILGQEVRRLIDDVKEAGKQSVVWDGRNNDSLLLSSGVYFATLRAGNFQSTQKMLILR